MSARPAEHWFDRLAEPRTRRQGFKALLAGAALTLPFVRAQPARASNSCRKGCVWTSHRSYNAAFENCVSNSRARLIEAGAVGAFINPFYGLALTGAAKLTFLRCTDNTLLEEKARQYDCLQPGCPGFDPASEYGPCVNCASINGCQCCADSTAPSGYTYCDNLIGKCCGAGGGCVNCSN